MMAFMERWIGKTTSVSIRCLFICAYTDKASRFIEDAKLTKKNTMYSEILHEFYSRTSKRDTHFREWISSLERIVRDLKDTMVRLLEKHFECEFFTMKFHLPHQLCDDLDRFRSIQFLDAAHYEHLTVLLKRSYGIFSMPTANRMRGTASVMELLYAC